MNRKLSKLQLIIITGLFIIGAFTFVLTILIEIGSGEPLHSYLAVFGSLMSIAATFAILLSREI